MRYGSVKYEHFDNLVADQNFTLPAEHIITAVVTRNNGVSGAVLRLRNGGANIMQGFSVSASMPNYSNANVSDFTMYDTDQTIQINMDNGWTNIDLDITIVMTDTSL